MRPPLPVYCCCGCCRKIDRARRPYSRYYSDECNDRRYRQHHRGVDNNLYGAVQAVNRGWYRHYFTPGLNSPDPRVVARAEAEFRQKFEAREAMIEAGLA